MRKFILLTTFFSITPFLLIFSIIFYTLNQEQTTQSNFLFTAQPQKQSVAYAALPSTVNFLDEQITTQNAQVEIIRQFLARYGSPLEPYAQTIVDEANAYGVDPRLLPAIAMQESNLCLKAPVGSNNCWGFGIYGHTIKTFPDYPTAIHAVTETLATKYIGKGLDTPDKIQHIYTPQSNGSWARSVNHFMSILQ